jgi:hypothetical protein
MIKRICKHALKQPITDHILRTDGECFGVRCIKCGKIILVTKNVLEKANK